MIPKGLKVIEEKVHISNVTDFWSTLTQIKTKSAESDSSKVPFPFNCVGFDFAKSQSKIWIFVLPKK